ncbi:MAG: hypothetical protein R2771_10375 [Saprospiraceae bacterium]
MIKNDVENQQKTCVFDSDVKSNKIMYRLKTVDLDGQIQYSNIIVINRNSKIDLNIYPNPFHNDLLKGK